MFSNSLTQVSIFYMSNDYLKTKLDEIFPKDKNLSDRMEWDMIEDYKQFLIEKNPIGGFFSKKDTDHILERHLLESIVFVLSLVDHGYVSRETKIADIGTGPGLPGFLFACLKESPHLTLLDSAKRKLGLLEDWWIQNSKRYSDRKIQFIYARAEECTGGFDLVTMRATIPYPFSIEVICRIVKSNGIFSPFLGKEYAWKKKESQILSETGFILKEEISLTSLAFLGERKIKVLKKKGLTKHGIPRDWKLISKDIKDVEWVK